MYFIIKYQIARARRCVTLLPPGSSAWASGANEDIHVCTVCPSSLAQPIIPVSVKHVEGSLG
jgi:hypothetical protein